MISFTTRERLIVAILSLGTFTGVLNIYLLTPFLKLVAAEFGVTSSAVGQLATTHALVAAAVGLLAAPLMDRSQRKNLLQVGLMSIALGTVLSASAWSFPVLLAARAFAGFGAAFLVSSCYAAAGDSFPDPSKRNRAIATLLAATGIGAVIGIPILTQLAAILGWRWAVGVLLVPIVAILPGIRLLPSRELARQSPLLADYGTRYRQVLHHPQTVWLLVAGVLRNVVWTAPIIYSVPIWIGLFHLSLQGYGWAFGFGGLTYFIGSNLAPTLMQRRRAHWVFMVACGVQIIAALAFPLASSSLPVALGLYFGVFAFAGAVGVVALNILLQETLPEVRGAVLSLSATGNQVGSALGGILGGLVLASLGNMALIPAIGVVTPLALAAVWWSARQQRAASGHDQASASQTISVGAASAEYPGEPGRAR